MRINTPGNIPTHMLENLELWITKSGRFIRTHSLDEFAQIWDIFIGNMSVIGRESIIGATKKSVDFSRVVTVN